MLSLAPLGGAQKFHSHQTEAKALLVYWFENPLNSEASENCAKFQWRSQLISDQNSFVAPQQRSQDQMILNNLYLIRTSPNILDKDFVNRVVNAQGAYGGLRAFFFEGQFFPKKASQLDLFLTRFNWLVWRMVGLHERVVNEPNCMV